MPRSITPAMLAALSAGYLRPALFAAVTFHNETVYVWTGVGSIVFQGNTYLGVGSLGSCSTIEEVGTVTAKGLTLTLSGLNPQLLNDVLGDYRVGLPCFVYLGLFTTANSTLASLTPATVTATDVFAPHWLFACQFGFPSATVHYNDTFAFANGVCTIPDSFALARYIFQVASVGYTLVYPGPYSPLASGTSFAVAGYTYNAATAATTITLTTPHTGTLAVIYSALDGPQIGVNEMYEAWPDWRPLATGERDAACDTFNWALRAYAAAYAVTADAQYLNAGTATAQQMAIVYNIDDSRDWLKPNYQLEPFAQGGSYKYSSMVPAPAYSCDAGGDVTVTIINGSSAGQAQYGIASINDVYASGNSTQVWAGSSIAQTLQVYIDTTNQSPYVDANRYYANLTLAGTGVQLTTLNASQFVNSSSTPLPVNAAVYTFGFQDTVTTPHTLTLQRVRQLPNLAIPYLAGAIPFTANFLGTPTSLIDWRGPVYTGYQSPYAFKKLGNETGVATNIQFLADSQAAWTAQSSTHDVGPFAPVFIFDRADAVQYGLANTWAWAGPDSNTGWCGYQYRPLAELAECIADCTGSESYYSQAVTVANNFLTWTDAFWSSALTGPPTDFPATGAQNNYKEVHIPALILRAVLCMASKFGMTSTYTSLMGKCETFWASMYQSSGATAGTFCPDLATDGIYGFQTGEILRTLAQWMTWANANSEPTMAATSLTWMNGLIAYASEANGLVNAAGLVANNVADQAGRGDYFSAGSGTSESEFLLLLGALNVYQATGNPQALTLANLIMSGLPLLYLGGAGLTLIDSPICSFMGRMDQPTVTVSGETCSLSINAESRLVDMQSSVERRYTQEQQQILYPNDQGFAWVNSIQSTTIYWGQQASTAMATGSLG